MNGINFGNPGSIFHLVIGNLRSQPLSTSLTTLLTAVALALSLATLSLKEQAKTAFLNGSGGYDAVLGAKGSAVQLVLNSLFHLETSPGNIPWSLYETVKRDKGVLRAYPLALGDSFRGYRIVGTLPELLTAPPTKGVIPQFAEGRVFESTRRETVVGSEVADKTGLTVGSVIHPSHGLNEHGHSHDETYLVVGVLKPTNSPLDRILWIPLEGVHRMDGHVLQHGSEIYRAKPGEKIPDDFKEISAVLIEFTSAQYGMSLSRKINRGEPPATLAFPVAQVVTEIFERIGWAHKLLSLFALMVLVVSSGAILICLTVSAQLRRRDYALLRSLGMPRRRLASLLIWEGIGTTLFGAVLSLPLTLLFSSLASNWVHDATGVHLNVLQFSSQTAWVLVAALILGGMAGILPAARVYSQDLSSQLVSENS